MKNLYFYKDLILWLAKVVEDYATASGSLASYQSKCNGNRVFLSHHGQNKYGRFMKLNEVNNRVIIGHLVILEGSQGCGRINFAKHARELMGMKISETELSHSIKLLLVLMKSPCQTSRSPNVSTGAISDSQTHSNAPFRRY